MTGQTGNRKPHAGDPGDQGRYDRDADKDFGYERENQNTGYQPGSGYGHNPNLEDANLENLAGHQNLPPRFHNQDDRGYGYGRLQNRRRDVTQVAPGWMVRGPHTGKGPRNYRRSDQLIQDEIHERLTQHGYLDASQIEVHVSNGEVTLRGNVPDRQQKRMAEDAVESVSGVQDVNNELHIAPSGG